MKILVNKKLLYLSYFFVLFAAFTPGSSYLYGFHNKLSIVARIPILNILYFLCSLGMFVFLVAAALVFILAHVVGKKKKLSLVEKIVYVIFVITAVLLTLSFPIIHLFCVYSSL